MSSTQYPEEIGESGFSSRALLVSILITVIVSMISTYIALMLSALPWPIIFSVIVSYSLLKVTEVVLKKKSSIHEVNVAQAGGSIGGLVSAGIVFTIPAIWYLNSLLGLTLEVPTYFQLVLIALSGGILGIALSIPVRRITIDKDDLPYPSGLAGAEVVITSMEGGIRARILLIAGLIASLYSLFMYPIILQGGYTYTLAVYGIIIIIGFIPLLVGFGAGYIIGPSSALISWFGGSIIGWIFLSPLLQWYGYTLNSALTYVKNLGVGIVFGAGIGFFLSYVITRGKEIYKPFLTIKTGAWYTRSPIYFSILAAFLLIIAGISPFSALVGILGSWIMSAIAGRVTGETNIDPLEQFGLFIGLLLIFVYSLLSIHISLTEILLITCFVSIASAVAGDIGHDFKSAKVIGTKPIDIVKVDLSAAIVAALIAPFAMFIVVSGYFDALFSPGSTLAFQSKLVGITLYGAFYADAFIIGFILGFIIEIISFIQKERKGKIFPISGMTLGVGMFIGLWISIPFAIGGLIRYLASKKKNIEDLGILFAAGVMGGEGITGFFVGFSLIFGFYSFEIMLVVSVVILLILAFLLIHSRLIGKNLKPIKHGSENITFFS